jgi:hypothetical protein
MLRISALRLQQARIFTGHSLNKKHKQFINLTIFLSEEQRTDLPEKER